MVYGNFDSEDVKEERPCKPIGIYGTLKYSGELLVKAYSDVFDLPYTIIRPSALYGERCVSRRVGQIFIENAIQNLDISINEGKFSCRVYDKRDKFGFKVVKFQPLMSNQASSVLYGTYCSQLVRYSRICNDVDAFSDRVSKITDDLIGLGVRRDRLSKIYLSVVRRHGLREKFGIGCGNVLLP